VEVKIGVLHTPREIVLESGLTPADVNKAVEAALKADLGVLSLIDEKGRTILVPADKIAYVEIGEGEGRRVGFGIG
jgi:3-hydroxyacyl-CoA dehydrogenase